MPYEFTLHLTIHSLCNLQTPYNHSLLQMSGEDLLRLIYDDKLTHENCKALQVLINYQRESEGYFTPLMNAIHFKRQSAIRTLLILGADPTIQVKVNYQLTTSF